MSDENKPEEKAEKPGWFRRLFWRFVNIALIIAIIGNAAFVSIYLFTLADARWHIPYIGAAAKRDAQFVPPKPEYGYVIEPLVLVVVPGKDELYGLRRKYAVQGVAFRKQHGTLVNVLTVNNDSNANRWMFKGTDRAILEAQAIYKNAEESEAGQVSLPAVAVIAMLIAEQDSNKDGEIGVGDRVSLYAYRMDGMAPEKVLTADHIAFDPGAPSTTTKVFYQDGGKSFVATYSTPGFKLLATSAIADMPKLVQQRTLEYDPRED
jgi:hypothetical protein